MLFHYSQFFLEVVLAFCRKALVYINHIVILAALPLSGVRLEGPLQETNIISHI